ncbi:hypothetical protein R3P38DRAFT_3375541, partial [Favolaschia claudopus]
MPKSKKNAPTKKKAPSRSPRSKEKTRAPSESSEEDPDETIRLKWLPVPPPGWRFDFNPNGPRNSDKSAPLVLIDHDDEDEEVLANTQEEFEAGLASGPVTARSTAVASSASASASARTSQPAPSSSRSRNQQTPPQPVPMTIKEHFERYGSLTHEAKTAVPEDFIIGRRPRTYRELPDTEDNHPFKCPICLHLKTHPVLALCGHMFCALCIRSCLRNSFECPMCKTVMLTAPIAVPVINSMIDAKFSSAEYPVKYSINWYNLPNTCLISLHRILSTTY